MIAAAGPIKWSAPVLCRSRRGLGPSGRRPNKAGPGPWLVIERLRGADAAAEQGPIRRPIASGRRPGRSDAGAAVNHRTLVATAEVLSKFAVEKDVFFPASISQAALPWEDGTRTPIRMVLRRRRDAGARLLGDARDVGPPPEAAPFFHFCAEGTAAAGPPHRDRGPRAPPVTVPIAHAGRR